ncbi:outer membrane beta-barrel family protein [Sphingobacterium sp. lm-10]|uniref:outer membrane beta-barrel family protein n=1 Tax=Sphingobacterium sp. lm-10 TaxID=2944904 RepID=UPI00202010AB|nr:outer membrane beta-barrel family protein [Sphingobacterium sp. lm-10]MCL7987179.1 outer membrane beta-barrel family protein [Sphingobacterium sp. lm-10]
MINRKTSVLLFYLVVSFLGIDITSAQQRTLKGKVLNKNKLPVEFVHAFLLKNDTVFVEGMVTDSLGTFLFKAEKGNYKLILEQFGGEYFNQHLELSQDVDMGEIEIDESVMLEGVTITVRKKLIEQKVDRMVFNVENSIASQGMSGLDALRNTPLIRLQNDNVSIVGKGGVAIMVNDRMLNLSGSELSNYLQSLRSEDITRIEIITTPPSKYEAQGNSGIINIILKKNPNLGWSGNINGAYQKTSFYGLGGNATVNYQSNKISSTLRLRQHDFSIRPEVIRNLVGTDNGIYTNEIRKDQSKAIGVNYTLDFTLSERQNIGFIYDYGHSNYNSNADGASIYESNQVVDSTLNTYQKQFWKTPRHTLNAYYDLKLDTLGKKVSFIGNYLNNTPYRVNDFSSINDITSNEDIARNTSDMTYNIYSGQADFMLPYNWLNIETGVKYTLFDNNSDLEYYNFVGSGYVINPQNSNVFNYEEHNYAAYISMHKDFNGIWSAKAGLRYEYTSLDGQTPGNDESIVIDNYGKLFPSAYVSFKPNDNHAFSLNYSKRINRPDFQSLNPFRWYINPYMYYAGNPVLMPSFNDNVELSYTFLGKLTAGLYNQYNRDGISNIARLEDGIYSNVMENSFNENTIGLRLNYYETFFKIWDLSLNTNGTFTKTTPTIPEAEGLEVYSMAYSVYNTISLNQNKTWFLLLNLTHDLPYVYANVIIQEQLNFSPGIKASFLDKKVNVSAVLSDAFKTLKSEGYSYNAGYRSEFYNYMDQRRFTFSMSYIFGNNRVKGVNKNVKFDEKSRAN